MKNERILIVGDSPGDLNAAKNINAKFFPIIPTKENQSWELFNNKYCNYFLNGVFSNFIEQQQINKFKSVLNINPFWLEK